MYDVDLINKSFQSSWFYFQCERFANIMKGSFLSAL